MPKAFARPEGGPAQGATKSPTDFGQISNPNCERERVIRTAPSSTKRSDQKELQRLKRSIKVPMDSPKEENQAGRGRGEKSLYFPFLTKLSEGDHKR